MKIKELEEIIIINGEVFYRIPNGTNYYHAPLPKQFKPYFERLQQENKELHNKIDKAIEYIEEHTTDHRYSCRSLVYADEVLKFLKDSDVDEYE